MEFNLSHHWHMIQTFLFPSLEEELGSTTEKHRQVIAAIEFARVDSILAPRYRLCFMNQRFSKIFISGHN